MEKIKKAVIPAAGYGTRLAPISSVIPKEMVPVRLKPMIQYSVEEAIRAGLDEIIIITRKEKKIIEDYFSEITLKDSSSKIVNDLKYIREKSRIYYVNQEEPKGLGDAIYRARKIIGEEVFTVLLPDNVYLEDVCPIKEMIEIYEGLGGNMVAVEKRSDKAVNESIYDYIEIDDRTLKIENILEKGYTRKTNPYGVNYEVRGIGRYILTSEFFDYVDRVRKEQTYVELDDTQPLQLMALKGKLYGYFVEGKRYDAGNPEGYMEIHEDW